MDSQPLVNEQIDAGAELVEKFDKWMPVTAAFWAKMADESQWTLFIASKGIDGADVGQGYAEVLRLTKAMQSPYLDPFQVKLVGADHPLARSVVEIHQRYPGASPVRFGGPTLGGQAIDGAYLYAFHPPVVTS
jgi:hypothetical protein